jgi:hypothetical protein
VRKRDWLRCSDPERMIEDVWRSGDLGFQSRRPFFTFVLTAGKRLWVETGGELLRPTVELAWRRAERKASDEEVEQHRDRMRAVYDGALAVNNWQLARLVNVLALLFREPGSAARTLIFPHPIRDQGSPPVPLLSPTELKNCCHLLREFFKRSGSDFSRKTWHTSTAVALASQMYDSRDFSAMPILADALQDAGCDNDDILNHCRDKDQNHVRGCWVVDLVLGKE